MKIKMKTSEEKCGSGNNSGNAKIRIAVIGQHEVGKSALTVRYLTRRYIGEYKSNADLLYRQTLTVSHGSSLDIEIMDISTSEETRFSGESVTFPQEEQLQRADAFIIVYSITDRSSFTFALQTLSTLSSYQHVQQQQQQLQQQNQNNSHHHNNHQNSPIPPSKSSSIVLLANKSDLEHLRTVEKVEGVSLAMQYGCNFYEVSVADNTPELYQSFHTIISNFASQNQTTSKRKFSVSKMLGNLRIGRTSPCQQVLSQASIIDTSATSNSSSSKSSDSMSVSTCSSATSPSSSMGSPSCDTLKSSQNGGNGGCQNGSTKICLHQRNSDPNNQHQNHSHSHSNISSSICNLKSKLVEFHSLKKRHNSPPICSL